MRICPVFFQVSGFRFQVSGFRSNNLGLGTWNFRHKDYNRYTFVAFPHHTRLHFRIIAANCVLGFLGRGLYGLRPGSNSRMRLTQADVRFVFNLNLPCDGPRWLRMAKGECDSNRGGLAAAVCRLFATAASRHRSDGATDLQPPACDDDDRAARFGR